MAAYVVKPGDTLSAIARRNNTTVAQLLAINPALSSDPKYNNGNVIFSGTKISLPGQTAADAATGTPSMNLDPATLALRKLTSGQTLNDAERTLLGMGPAATTPAVTPSVTLTSTPTPTVASTEVKPEIAGTSTDLGNYLTSVDLATEALAQAQAANTLALRTSQAQYEPEIRQAERGIYGAEMQALNALAQRGITGQAGLAEAAKRSARLAPVQERTAALEKLAAAQRQAGVLLPEQIAKAQRDREAALQTLTKASRISNQLGGRNG